MHNAGMCWGSWGCSPVLSKMPAQDQSYQYVVGAHRHPQPHYLEGAVVAKCDQLIESKGHGDAWCLRSASTANCGGCKHNAEKLLGEWTSGTWVQDQLAMKAKLDKLDKHNAWLNGRWHVDRWYHRLGRALLRAWRQHVPRTEASRRAKCLSMAPGFQPGPTRMQEVLTANKLRETYELLIKNYCPACETTTHFDLGPEGGCASTIKCECCNAEFWYFAGTREAERVDDGEHLGSGQES